MGSSALNLNTSLYTDAFCFSRYALLTIVMVTPTTAQSTDIDLKASDGVTLKATYTSPGRPGPAMLLIHQCNMDRSSWTDISKELVDAGIHVLTMDLRGFGDSGGEGMSGGFPKLLQKSSGDLDMAYAYLISQTGVDSARVGVGGASCGAMLTSDLATRQSGITTLMLLSGPPGEDATAHIMATPGLAVFGAAAEDDSVIAGVAVRHLLHYTRKSRFSIVWASTVNTKARKRVR